MMHTNWLDGTDTWSEILKRVLQYNFRDLRACLESALDGSTLEHPDMLGCALAAARAVSYPKLFSAIERDLGSSVEKQAAMQAVADAAMNSVWSMYDSQPAFSEVDRLDVTGSVDPVKYTMYLLSAYLVLGNQQKVEQCIDFLNEKITKDQISSIVRIAAVVKASALAQI